MECFECHPNTLHMKNYALLMTSCVLCSCSDSSLSPLPGIPGPAYSVTPSQSLAIARAYAEARWVPEEKHVRHGRDGDGILVHTPDRGLKLKGVHRGWWSVGKEARGIPYKWGGFDTPVSFPQCPLHGEGGGGCLNGGEEEALGKGREQGSGGDRLLGIYIEMLEVVAGALDAGAACDM